MAKGRARAAHIDDLPPHIANRIRAAEVKEQAEDADAREAREDARKMLVRLARTCIAGGGEEPTAGFPEYTNSQWLARMVVLTLGRDSDR